MSSLSDNFVIIKYRFDGPMDLSMQQRLLAWFSLNDPWSKPLLYTDSVVEKQKICESLWDWLYRKTADASRYHEEKLTSAHKSQNNKFVLVLIIWQHKLICFWTTTKKKSCSWSLTSIKYNNNMQQYSVNLSAWFSKEMNQLLLLIWAHKSFFISPWHLRCWQRGRQRFNQLTLSRATRLTLCKSNVSCDVQFGLMIETGQRTKRNPSVFTVVLVF